MCSPRTTCRRRSSPRPPSQEGRSSCVGRSICSAFPGSSRRRLRIEKRGKNPACLSSRGSIKLASQCLLSLLERLAQTVEAALQLVQGASNFGGGVHRFVRAFPGTALAGEGRAFAEGPLAFEALGVEALLGLELALAFKL